MNDAAYTQAVASLGEFGPGKTYTEILAEAKRLDKDSAPAEVEAVVLETAELSHLERRRVFEAIKKATGIPYSDLNRALNQDDDGPPDQLELARHGISVVGAENILSTDSGVWQWSGAVWETKEDRALKQLVQRHLPERVETVSKSLVDGVTDLFKNEVYQPNLEFDVGPPECINCRNGEIALENGNWILRPHDREHYRTTMIPVEYDPDAQAPRFNQFMLSTFQGDRDASDKIVALLEMVGYTLMAHCRHERFIILVGSGANGKSVLLAVLEALCGPANVAGVQPSQFGHSPKRAHLHTKLANIVTEIKQGEVIDDASLKGIVSGEPTTVDHKYGHPFVMRPFSTCWFGTNHMPHTRDFSDALFRRALVVQFNNVFKPELGNCDPDLKEALLEELPGILNMALMAYANALEQGFTMPESCREAREKWRLEADQVAQFIEDECITDPAEEMQARPLFRAYQDWTRDCGINRPVAEKAFRDRLEKLGYGSHRRNYGRMVTGLRLRRGYDDAG